LGEDFLHDALREVFLNLLKFLIRGKFFTKRFGGQGQVVAALPAEFELRRIHRIALRADLL
jgi:hypothetical protein